MFDIFTRIYIYFLALKITYFFMNRLFFLWLEKPNLFQGRMPFMRAMSMEQRWQDLASLLSLPGAPDHFAHPAHPGYPGHGISHSHYEAQRNVLLHNPTLAPPVGDLNSTGPYHNVGECCLKLYGSSLFLFYIIISFSDATEFRNVNYICWDKWS